MVKMSGRSPLHSSPSEGSTSPSSNEFQVISPPSSHFNGGTFSHLNDIHLAISTAPFDLSPEEIQSRLRDILKENVELKEALQQNNCAMREQFNRLLAWQADVAAVHSQHKEKFEETRTLIQRLHAENLELQLQLKQQNDAKKEHELCEHSSETLQKQVAELQQRCEETKQQNERLVIGEMQLKDSLTEANSNFERLKITNSRLLVEKQDLMAMNNELQAKVAGMSSQATSEAPSLEGGDPNSYVIVAPTIPKEISRNIEKSKNETKGIKELLVQLRTEQAKCSALMAEVVGERKKNSIITKELTETKAKLAQSEQTASLASSSQPSQPTEPSPAPASSPDKLPAFLQDLKDSEVKFSMASTYLTRYKDRCCSLENWLGEYQERLESLRSKDDELIDQLRVEVGNLRKTLIKEQSLNQDDKKHLLETRQRFELLLKDYQELLKSWEAYEKEQTSRGRQSEAYYELQVRSLQEQVDSLTAKLVSCEESLLAKQDEIRRLSKQVKAQMLESDRIPILQAQMEVYQTDFRAEREAREKMRQERDRLIQELRDMQGRNQQLVDELEVFQKSQFAQMREQTGPRRAGFSGTSKNYSRMSAGSSAYSSSADLEYDGCGKRSNWSAEAGASVNARPLRNTRPPDPDLAALRQTGVTPRLTTPRQQVSDCTASPDENMYFCPKCNLGFTEFQPLENHVNMCLDIDDPFVL